MRRNHQASTCLTADERRTVELPESLKDILGVVVALEDG